MGIIDKITDRSPRSCRATEGERTERPSGGAEVMALRDDLDRWLQRFFEEPGGFRAPATSAGCPPPTCTRPTTRSSSPRKCRASTRGPRSLDHPGGAGHPRREARGDRGQRPQRYMLRATVRQLRPHRAAAAGHRPRTSRGARRTGRADGQVSPKLALGGRRAHPDARES